MRQQCVSTGKTFLPSEYIITHRATFGPTEGNARRNSSAWQSENLFNGAKVSFPKRSMMMSEIFRIARDFCFANPPERIARSICFTLATARDARVGNRTLRLS